MSLNNLIQWCVGVIIAWNAIAHIDEIQRSILKAEAALLYESRASSWGSPRFFNDLADQVARRGSSVRKNISEKNHPILQRERTSAPN